MPAAWDVTSAGATAGSGGCATDTRRRQVGQVHRGLQLPVRPGQERQDLRDQPGLVRGGRPVEAVVVQHRELGSVTSFVPNTAYSGSPKPQLAGVTYYAYTDDSSEYTALKTGQVDVGQVPDQDLAPVSGGQVLPPTTRSAAGSTSSRRTRTASSTTDQLQQPGDRPGVQAVVRPPGAAGAGRPARHGQDRPPRLRLPDRRRRADQPANPWTPAIETSNFGQGPYPFSIADATVAADQPRLADRRRHDDLRGRRPQCGAGIAAGTKLAFTMDYATGTAAFEQESRRQVGRGPGRHSAQPGGAVRSTRSSASPRPARPRDDLQLGMPSASAAGTSTAPASSDRRAAVRRPARRPTRAATPTRPRTRLIGQTHTSNSLSVFDQYATYTAQQLPYIWMPTSTPSRRRPTSWRRRLQPARHVPARVLVLHQVTRGLP